MWKYNTAFATAKRAAQVAWRAAEPGGDRPRTLLESAPVDRAGAADFRWRLGRQGGAESLVSRAVPDGRDTLLGHVAQVNAFGRRDHAAGHGQSLVTHVGAAPGPIAALWP